jgi:hypothetical protein
MELVVALIAPLDDFVAARLLSSSLGAAIFFPTKKAATRLIIQRGRTNES